MLQEAILHVHSLLAACDNVGKSDDWADLSYLVDYLAFKVGKSLPSHPCQEGCDGCCMGPVAFPVTEIEWEGIRGYLDRRGMLERYREAARSLFSFEGERELLERLASGWERKEDPVVPAESWVCPLLVEGRCQVYAVRPLICRAYGFFAVLLDEKETLLMCQRMGEVFREKLEREKTVPLPMWEPFRRRLREINGGAVKPLPLWLLEA